MQELIIGQFRPPKKDWLTERLESLASTREHALTTDEDRKNIDAVVRAYEDGTLKRPSLRKIVIFFGGVCRTGEVEMDTFDWMQLLEWGKALNGKGRLFIEDV